MKTTKARIEDVMNVIDEVLNILDDDNDEEEEDKSALEGSPRTDECSTTRDSNAAKQ